MTTEQCLSITSKLACTVHFAMFRLCSPQKISTLKESMTDKLVSDTLINTEASKYTMDNLTTYIR